MGRGAEKIQWPIHLEVNFIWKVSAFIQTWLEALISSILEAIQSALSNL
jgi:hypothetical protein